MRWPEVQDRFAEALRHPELVAPDAVAGRQGRPVSKRFDVYRNNCVVSLCEALAAGFPVVETLVGEEFFKAMARVYVGEHPPCSPVLMEYGETFARFLEEAQLSADTLDKTFCHQVGSSHRKLMLEAMGIALSKDFATLEWLGNTGSVALPTAMAIGTATPRS